MRFSKLIKDFIIEKEASLKLEEIKKFEVSEDGKELIEVVTSVSAVLLSKKGVNFLSASSTVSTEQAVANLERKIEKYINERLSKQLPYAKLKDRIELITKELFRNSKADPLSSRATFNGWDINIDDKGQVFIRIHNAANVVVSFDALDTSNRALVNTESLGSAAYGGYELSKLLKAINEYLYVDKEIRREELLDMGINI